MTRTVQVSAEAALVRETRNAEIFRLRAEGVGPTEIGRRLGLSVATVGGVRRRPQPRPIDPDADPERPETIARAEEVMRMRLAGMTAREIARHWGMSTNWVHRLSALARRRSGALTRSSSGGEAIDRRGPLAEALAAAVAAGESTASVAARTGLSRSTVLQIADRVRLDREAERRAEALRRAAADWAAAPRGPRRPIPATRPAPSGPGFGAFDVEAADPAVAAWDARPLRRIVGGVVAGSPVGSPAALCGEV